MSIVCEVELMYVPMVARPLDRPTNLNAGLGCVECEGRCGGMGLFSQGFLNIAEWGWWEWGAIGLGALILMWTFTPGGSEYREERARLRRKYRGYRRVGRRAMYGVQRGRQRIAEAIAG